MFAVNNEFYLSCQLDDVKRDFSLTLPPPIPMQTVLVSPISCTQRMHLWPQVLAPLITVRTLQLEHRFAIGIFESF